jgi:hypothetical protein
MPIHLRAVAVPARPTLASRPLQVRHTGSDPTAAKTAPPLNNIAVFPVDRRVRY